MAQSCSGEPCQQEPRIDSAAREQAKRSSNHAPVKRTMTVVAGIVPLLGTTAMSWSPSPASSSTKTELRGWRGDEEFALPVPASARSRSTPGVAAWATIRKSPGRAGAGASEARSCRPRVPPERGVTPGDHGPDVRNDQDRRCVIADRPGACSAGPDVPPQSSGATSAMDCEKFQ